MLLFVLFGLTLLGIAVFHKHNLRIALLGAGAIASVRFHIGFHGETGWSGLGNHALHEWVSVTNIFLLIMGFELVSKYFEASHLPVLIPKVLPDDWKGGLVLLAMVFTGSIFLDNIAAAMIGGAIATAVYRGKVSVGFVAAIVGCSNAGGAFSPIGDTTTTMMWISGVPPTDLLPAVFGSVTAFMVMSVIASRQQQLHHPVIKDPPKEHRPLDMVYLGLVFLILGCMVTTNVIINKNFKSLAEVFPWVGVAVWAGILIASAIRTPHWVSLKGASKSALFLSMLILSASMMPIEELPRASTKVTFALGLWSAFFDNIPLAALAIKQGGYKAALLAYSVGFGGSITWFGSSAGVAICNDFPQAKSLWAWLKGGWFIFPAYVAGFLAIVAYTAIFG